MRIGKIISDAYKSNICSLHEALGIAAAVVFLAESSSELKKEFEKGYGEIGIQIIEEMGGWDVQDH